MKRLLCGTMTALLISAPLFAQTPSSSTMPSSGSMDESKTTTEEVKRTTSPSGEVTEEVERMEDSSMAPSHSDSSSPGHMDSTKPAKPKSSTTPSGN